MVPGFAIMLLCATPAKVAVPEWTTQGVTQAVADAFLDRFAVKLSEARISVITPRDIKQVVGLDRQRELLGCKEAAASCLAELSGALGVDAIVSGTIVKVGSAFTVTVRALSGTDGRELASASERLKSEDEVQDWLDQQARQLGARIVVALGGRAPDVAPPAQVTAPPAARRSPWVLLSSGAAASVLGAVLYGLSRKDVADLSADRPAFTSADAVHAARVRGETLEKVGVGAMIVGGLVAVGGLFWLLLGDAAPVAVLPQAGGVVVSAGGRWP